ncbi:ankyrin repeat-containing protein BDA1 isoform X1 [Ziziphus jujuba]|uniref:Ankyrin repeat-containing protein BDA1 isoform X1 n=1 Tax=Ziziphus jujuba TaxID=326968 RepID=A0ABM3I2V5_ZIZJJ|nr:ankyrin repeat-containing protein BDA1 isoform X1 [Ziziphus jujuba]
MSTFFFLFHFLCGIMFSPNRMEGTLNNAEAAQREYESMEDINDRKMKEMKAAAEEGRDEDIAKLIGDDPYVLQRFDRVPYINTPLHIAAKHGHTPFAMEMVSFKPSFLTKLNPEGLCPLLVALQNGRNDLALRLLEVDRDLIPCEGRKRTVFLHYLAQEGNIDLLKMFLKASPKSFQDMTTRRETVLHVTLKNGKLDAFYFLVGYLQRVQHEGSSTQETEILNRKDYEGNTILHIAVQKNISEVVELLIDCGVDINTKNTENLTALDILDDMQVDNREVRKMLNAAGALKASNLTIPIPFTADSLKRIPSFKERLITSIIRFKRDIPHDTRNALLVITVLIATVTCQGSLTPPGGVWQDSNSSTAQVHQAALSHNMTLTGPLLTVSTTVLIAIAAFTNFPMLLLFCALNMLLLSF